MSYHRKYDITVLFYLFSDLVLARLLRIYFSFCIKYIGPCTRYKTAMGLSSVVTTLMGRTTAVQKPLGLIRVIGWYNWASSQEKYNHHESLIDYYEQPGSYDCHKKASWP